MKEMRVVKSVLWGSAVAALLATAPAWAELKIAYVNYQQLAEQSPQAKAIQDALRSEFLPKQRELQNQQQSLKNREDKLQKDGATMTEEQRSHEEKELRDGARDLARKQQEAQDDLNSRRNEELSRLQRTLVDEVRTYAKSQNYDLVFADGVIYATPAIDITAQVLSQLEAHTPKSGSTGAPAAAPAPAKAAKPAPAK
jgi:outer membrane protein